MLKRVTSYPLSVNKFALLYTALASSPISTSKPKNKIKIFRLLTISRTFESFSGYYNATSLAVSIASKKSLL